MSTYFKLNKEKHEDKISVFSDIFKWLAEDSKPRGSVRTILVATRATTLLN